MADSDETPLDDAGEGPQLKQVRIRKQYSGEIVGTGIAVVLLAQGGAGSGYVASERVTGTLLGRSGSFVVQHVGVADGSELEAHGVVVPHSGTGELAGIAGRAYEAEMGVLTLELDT